ncbi:patatin-like phospholipase family protein [Aquibacillus rhizosphaerae]|uniref:Patatin family protein n=1 Tax=Aquibacillus rhizosphaerae TaxID=3051431 RepID=A0ABT7L9V6_9BACI|nr:patatin family protein [Aquibacillus sp. LR5S19]MDL4842164.1 patatin family protein [Aquibacillus sp. LR5S19]
MDNIGLILEGGGMRGAYTAGVLDFFHDEQLVFPYIVGASAGACNGSSYVSNQRGRNYEVIVEYGDHPEYISYKRVFRHKELFGMDFIFDTLPNKLVPFDFDSYLKNNSRFVVSTTDIDTGEPVYYSSFESKEELLSVVRASSSLPFISRSVRYKGRNLMDGGISDPIPIEASIKAGNEKHVVVLTRNEGYLKKPMKFSWLVNRGYKRNPELIRAMQNRHLKYNDTIEQLKKMEQRNEVLIIRPKKTINVSRIERNKDKLHNLYTQGYQDAKNLREKLYDFLNEKSKLPHLH